MRDFITKMLVAVGLLTVTVTAASAVSVDLRPAGEMKPVEVADSAATDAATLKPVPVESGGVAVFHAKAAENEWKAWEEYTTGTLDEFGFYGVKTQIINNGGVWPENKPYTVYRRENIADPQLVQFKFAGIFNNVDIIFDYNRSTLKISANPQPTGIMMPEAMKVSAGTDSYDELMFMMYPVYFFEESNCLSSSSNVWMLVAPALGFQCGIRNNMFALDNYRDLTIGFGGIAYGYIPAGQTSKTVNLDIPDGVSKYRLARFSERQFSGEYTTFFLPNVAALYGPGIEDATVEYTELSAPSLDVTTDETVSYITVVPINDAGMAVAPYRTLQVYRNSIPDGEWKSLGKGKLTEHFWTMGADSEKVYSDPNMANEYYQYIAPPAVQEIEVEYLESNPAVYRIKNPFSSAHPYSAYMLERVSDSEDFYMVFDTTDPSKVLVPESLSGMTDRNDIAPHIMMDYYSYEKKLYALDPSTVDDHYNNSYGKLIDKKISFNYDGLRFYSLFTSDYEFMLELELPGYEEYSMVTGKWPDVVFDENGASVGVTEITENVARIEFAMFPEELYADDIRFSPEKLARMIADRAEGVKVHSAVPSADRTATLTVPAVDVPNGFSYMVAVLVDAYGNYHTPYLLNDRVYNPTPLSQWESAGTCYATGVFLPVSGVKTKYTYELDVRKSPDIDGLYCFYEPFKTEYDFLLPLWTNESLVLTYDSTENRHLFINASNPEAVYIMDDPAGYEIQMGSPLNTGLGIEGYGTLELAQGTGDYGKLAKNIDGFDQITFSDALVFRFPGMTGDDFYFLNDMTFVLDYDSSRDLSLAENWDKVADVEVEENLVNFMVDKSDISTTVHKSELRVRPNMPGVYALINPLAPVNGNIPASMTYDGEDHHVFVNVTNPGKVFACDNYGEITSAVTLFPSGYRLEGNENLRFANIVGLISDGRLDPSQYNPDDYYGVAQYNDDNSLYSIDLSRVLYPADDTNVYNIVDNNVFRVKVKQSGVDSIVDDDTAVGCDDVPVVYYNLQGVQVANPGPGVYIRRQGDRVTKVVIR